MVDIHDVRSVREVADKRHPQGSEEEEGVENISENGGDAKRVRFHGPLEYVESAVGEEHYIYKSKNDGLELR